MVGPGGCGGTVRARDPRHDVSQINLHSNTSHSLGPVTVRAKRCTHMSCRWINLLSMPFLFFSTGLPLLMLRHNCHPKTVQKILLWTPVVPLVIVQVALRAIVLTTLISDSADRVWAVCEALEGWSLLLQVVVFILMDSY